MLRPEAAARNTGESGVEKASRSFDQTIDSTLRGSSIVCQGIWLAAEGEGGSDIWCGAWPAGSGGNRAT